MKPQLTEQSERKLLAEFDPTPSMYYVYVLKDTVTGDFYYGYTNNIERRTIQYIKERDWKLVYYEAYRAESDARSIS